MNYSDYVKKHTVNLTQEQQRELLNDRDKNSDKITKSFLPMVLYMANSFQHTTSLDMDELFSAGLEGLMLAINNYDLTNKAPLKSYVGICIRTAMIASIRNSNIIKQPTDKSKWDTRMVMSVDNSDDNLWDILPDNSTEYTKEWIDDIEIRERVRDLVNDRTANIFLSYFGMGTKKLKSTELMVIYGVTRSRINQLIHITLKKIREDETFLQLVGRFIN
tara:strand:+ start:993 stop:1649 length:657 start_codon:yes stop_codon:yes gene_type:complete